MSHEFVVEDCSLVRCATGRACYNLRELLDAMRSMHTMVLEHHLMRCALEDHFELYEFPNDLARWCWDALGDRELAEELALLNPYARQSIEGARAEVVDVLEDHLWALERVPWCRPGLELHLVESRLVAFDTGERFSTLAGLVEALPRMSRRSLFYHVHEAYRRKNVDDFSTWLAKIEAPEELVHRVRKIDFYFLNLNQLREQLLEHLCAFLAEPKAILGGAA
ncbi:MAG TPA: DUF5752 family protein [Pirellulales bacterium]|nr:DUF5752 family protein [Pirellulales bacterium]